MQFPELVETRRSVRAYAKRAIEPAKLEAILTAIRLDGYAVAVSQQAIEVGRFAVDQNQFHLGVRHPESLDHVFGRGCLGARHAELGPSPLGRQEVVEFLSLSSS
jgi:hypothetical protein